jgi:response regulator RpfG family c-di-GMP phosphodiesterase
MSVEVPVCTNDEFGSMAYYTNKMIRKLRQYTSELKASKKVTILCLSSLAESRDNETGAHILRTKFYVLALARKLKNHPRFSAFLDDETINLLGNCSQLHDIGKVGIPDSILLKPGKLTPEEFEIMKRHTIIGRDAFLAAKKRLGSETTPFLELAQEIVYTHHEKWDGTGYPQGLKGEEIPISGRIMALADVYDALISKRVYKEAFSHEKAKEIIISERGKHFDPDIVDAFLAVEEKFKRIAHVYIDSCASDGCTLGEQVSR